MESGKVRGWRIVGRLFTRNDKVFWQWRSFGGRFSGVKKMSKNRIQKRMAKYRGKIRADRQSKKRLPQSQNGRRPGKPTIGHNELIGRRNSLACALENHWGDVGWDLKCARTIEDIRTALQPLSKGPDQYPLNLLLRPTVAQVFAGAIRETKKKLGVCGERLPGVYERQRRAREAFQKAEWAALEVSDQNQQQLQAEIKRRKGAIRELKIKISDKNAEIRRKELLVKNAEQQNRPSLEDELKSLKSELEKIEMDISTENEQIAQIEDRLRAITPEKRKLADKVYAKRKSELDTANQEASEVTKEYNELQEMLSDQQAHYCQRELLTFIRGKRYGHTSRKLASAIAGLPQISCRQSAARCAKVPYAWEPNCSIFEFVQKTWRQRDPQPNAEQSLDLFRTAIAALPKTLLSQAAQDGSRCRIDNYFRNDLCDKWFYLKQAIKDAVLAYTHPDQVPYLITAKFNENIAKPRTAVDELIATQDKLEL
jgi:hypothetical protein